MIITIAAMMLQAASAPASVEPTIEHFSEVVEPAIKERLVDPDSAKFEWPYTFTRQDNGLVTCGFVNSKNRMGGYTGRTYVIVVYNEGRAPYFNIAEQTSGWDGVYGMCDQFVRKGKISKRT